MTTREQLAAKINEYSRGIDDHQDQERKDYERKYIKAVQEYNVTFGTDWFDAENAQYREY